MRLIIGPILGAGLAFAAGLSTSVALADEPPQSEQGTRFHGTGFLEQGHVNIDPASAVTVAGCMDITLEQGAFHAGSQAQAPGPCTVNEFIGATFTAAGDPALSFTVQAARPHANIYQACRPTGSPPLANEGWEYSVTWSKGGHGGELCPGHNFALAVPMAWKQDAEMVDGWKLAPSGRYFTFACIPRPLPGCDYEGGGVIAKCTDWGYPPWKPSLSGVALTGHALVGMTTGGAWLQGGDELQALSFHQACLKMATADYCGVGESNTFDGTPIAFSDLIGVPLKQTLPNPDGVAPHIPSSSPGGDLYFEAAWVDCTASKPTPYSACDSEARLRSGHFGALCLSKKRWTSMPTAYTCFDPQGLQTQPGPHTFMKFCEQYTEKELEALGARFFSFSRFLDVGLYQFTGLSSVQGALTTTAYVVGEGTGLPPILPDSRRLGLGAQPAGVTARLEGALLSRDLPESLQARLNLRGLYRCVSVEGRTRRYLTNVADLRRPEAACAPLPGAKLDTSDPADPRAALEGHVSPIPQGASNTPLYLWADGKGSFITSTTQPGPQWTPTLLGYIPGSP
jgi:hypothetical protein